ncbi:MAG: winged helix-turn-helix transcriptional regulator [Nitrososphaerota archaeon]|nr:winged helix-turn-helix transcriptional regulator [Nitrososphaerota archaeon]
MVDITTLVLLAISFFFVALSVGLLVKYRQISERANASTDLGRDLWSSLEQRLRKQDERILDMMGRVEVIQSRVTGASVALAAVGPSLPPRTPPPGPRSEAEPASSHIQGQIAQQPESQEQLPSQVVVANPKQIAGLDETQLAALKLLSETSRNTRQLTDALGKSREHVARIMKGLFESGLVRRNDSSKPFVYELTDAGRLRLSNL